MNPLDQKSETCTSESECATSVDISLSEDKNQSSVKSNDKSNDKGPSAEVVMAKSKGPWTEKEHCAFLEGFEKYGMDWKQIAAYVKSRNAEEVQRHFHSYQKKEPFLFRLRKILDDKSLENIIAWVPHGRSFVVFNRVCMRVALPLYFGKFFDMDQFQRELYAYGFRQDLSHFGFDAGIWFHPYFCRDSVLGLRGQASKSNVCSNKFCDKTPHNLMKCTGCHKVQYCSLACQHTDWRFHMWVCGEDMSGNDKPSGMDTSISDNTPDQNTDVIPEESNTRKAKATRENQKPSKKEIKVHDRKGAMNASTDVFKGIKYVNITVSGLSEKFISLNNDYGLKRACTMKDDPEGYQEARDKVYALSRVLQEPPTFTTFIQYFPELAHRFHDSSLRSAILRFKKEFLLVRFDKFQTNVESEQKENGPRGKRLKKNGANRNKGQKRKPPSKSDDSDETNIKSIAHKKMRKMLEVNADLSVGEFANKHPDIAAKFDTLDLSLGCTLGNKKRSMSSEKKVSDTEIQEDNEEKIEARGALKNTLVDVIYIDCDSEDDSKSISSKSSLNTDIAVSLQNTITDDIGGESKNVNKKEKMPNECNSDDSNLPDGWVKLIDESSGRPYYKNYEDDIAQWWPPEKEIDKKLTNLFNAQQAEQNELVAESSDEQLYENLASWFSSVMNDYSCEYKCKWNEYAGKFSELGFHSVELIKEHCDAHLIDGPIFSWMLLCHKQGLKRWLVENS